MPECSEEAPWEGGQVRRSPSGQVPQPTCYCKWHSWQLGNLTSLLQMSFPPSPIGEPAFQSWSNVEKPASGKLILPWFHGSNKFNWSKMLNFPISEELVNSSKFQIREGKGSFEGEWKVLLLVRWRFSTLDIWSTRSQRKIWPEGRKGCWRARTKSILAKS